MPKFSDINNKTAEQMGKIKAFLRNPKGFLLLTGANGTGKSFVAEVIYCIHSTFKLPQYDMEEAFFINQSDLNERWLKEKNEGNTLDFSSRIKLTKLLVLDDLGIRTPSEAFVDFLFSVIDYRWRFRDTLGTIITTNMTATITREKLGDPILSRIGSGVIIRFEGEDRRIIDF